MKLTDVDRRVGEAFEDLVKWAKSSRQLGKIARKPDGQHERTIAYEFYRLLLKQEWGDVAILPEHGSGYRRDIVALSNTKMIFAVEVKTPFANSGGISDKTNKKGHLPKDTDSLKAALDDGAARAYYLWTPIGCHPVDRRGNMLGGSNKDWQEQFGIRWPTSPNYEVTGKQQIDTRIAEEADRRNLAAKRIKGWIKVELPRPRSGLHAFLDCALYMVRKKT